MISTERPFQTLSDGQIKVAIWRNVSADGKPFYPVQLTRSYRDENEEWRDTNTFTNSELLRASRLLDRAYDAVSKLKEIERKAQPPGQ